MSSLRSTWRETTSASLHVIQLASHVIDYVESSISYEGKWVGWNLWEAVQEAIP